MVMICTKVGNAAAAMAASSLAFQRILTDSAWALSGATFQLRRGIIGGGGGGSDDRCGPLGSGPESCLESKLHLENPAFEPYLKASPKLHVAFQGNLPHPYPIKGDEEGVLKEGLPVGLADEADNTSKRWSMEDRMVARSPFRDPAGSDVSGGRAVGGTVGVEALSGLAVRSLSLFSRTGSLQFPAQGLNGLLLGPLDLADGSQPVLGRRYSTNFSGQDEEGGRQPQLSRKDQLKRAVKDYGSTVIVFHVAISLTSLGISYFAVSSGIDVVSYLMQLPYVGERLSSSQAAAGASTFVVAYAVHKVFAPVRISITLTATPIIVRYLRARGILRTTKK